MRTTFVTLILGVLFISTPSRATQLRIEMKETHYSTPAKADPILIGPPDVTTIYMMGGESVFAGFFLQAKNGDDWHPKYEYTCAELFSGKVVAHPSWRWKGLGAYWSEVTSTITPKGFKVAPGVYRFSLVYTTINPSTMPAEQIPCWLIQSPEFTLTREAYYEGWFIR